MRRRFVVAVASPRAAAPRPPRSLRAQAPRRPRVTILKPARVFDGEAMHEGWAVRVKGDRIDAVGPAASVAAAGRGGHRPAGHDADARAGRGPLARPAAPLQRDVLERSGVARRARAAGGARDQSPARDADGRLHHRPRSRHRRRRLRGRRAEAGGRPGHHSGPAHARHDARDRRDRQLRAEVHRPSGRCRRAPKKPTASTASRASCAIRSARAPTGSRSTPTTAGARCRDRGRPSRSTS